MVPFGMDYHCGRKTSIANSKELKSAMCATVLYIRIHVNCLGYRAKPAGRNSTAHVCIAGSVQATNPHAQYVEIYFRVR